MAEITTTSTAGSASGAIAAINAPSTIANRSGLAELDQGDFLRLLTVQLQQQDPFEPVDNKEMLAQMAQFSQLAGSSTSNALLGEISDKLDALIDAQQSAASAIGSTGASQVSTNPTV